MNYYGALNRMHSQIMLLNIEISSQSNFQKQFLDSIKFIYFIVKNFLCKPLSLTARAFASPHAPVDYPSTRSPPLQTKAPAHIWCRTFQTSLSFNWCCSQTLIVLPLPLSRHHRTGWQGRSSNSAQRNPPRRRKWVNWPAASEAESLVHEKVICQARCRTLEWGHTIVKLSCRWRSVWPRRPSR